jgi:hypothetical protein
MKVRAWLDALVQVRFRRVSGDRFNLIVIQPALGHGLTPQDPLSKCKGAVVGDVGSLLAF